MQLKPIRPEHKEAYNKAINHILQSWEWGEFRESLGLPVLRYGIYEHNKLKTAFTLTLHKIPFTNSFVGYLPKGPLPDKNFAQILREIGKEHRCSFIKIEPNVEVIDSGARISKSLRKSPKPLFAKHTFMIDLRQSEEQLLKNMSSKTRYNIKIAQKHGVIVEERTDDQAFEIYLNLYFATTKRQGYHGHDKNYHRKVWKYLKSANLARLLIATYQNEPLTAWMLFNFKGTLYYPYGGSSIKYRNVMANNLVAWEAIKLGKRLKLKYFDMWGALGPNASEQDPWYGFHKFKQGYGGRLVEYIGTYDLVFNYPLYYLFTFVDKLMPLKLFLLKLIKK